MPEAERPSIGLSMVAFDYFRAIGAPLIAGRVFREDEMSSKEYAPVTLLNESAAALLFPGQSAIGQRIFYQHNKKRPYEVIGIVKDARDLRVEEKPLPAGFITMAFPDAQFIVRVKGDVSAAAAMLRREVARSDPLTVVNDVRPMREIVSRQVAERKFMALLLGVFAVIALGIAAVGVFGVVGYQVAQRRREFGIRLALGATPGRVLRQVLRWSSGIVGLGVLIGFPLALAGGRLLRAQLFEISEVDPRVFAGAALVLLATAQVACWFPARRAAEVAPIEALRCD